jgi:hypothetical protein
MTHRIRIYRSIGRCGSVISTELVDEFDVYRVPNDLQQFAESRGGDFAVVETTPRREEVRW